MKLYKRLEKKGKKNIFLIDILIEEEFFGNKVEKIAYITISKKNKKIYKYFIEVETIINKAFLFNDIVVENEVVISPLEIKKTIEEMIVNFNKS